MKIYTKTGDKGKTSLFGGAKISKSDLRINSYGTVDELNSHIGLCGDLISFKTHQTQVLNDVQNYLFVIGSYLATPPDDEKMIAMLPPLSTTAISELEHEIDTMTETLPPMKHFILPGGNATVSQIHIARCVARRAERACVALAENDEKVDDVILIYLNRLSDYLFVLARYVGKKLGVPEKEWKPITSQK